MGARENTRLYPDGEGSLQVVLRPSLDISALFGLLSLVHDSGKGLAIMLGHYSSWQAILAAICSPSSWALTRRICQGFLWTGLRF